MIGLILRTYKEEHGLTVRQMAQLLDEHYSTISLWMTGKRQPSVRQIRKIRELTQVPYEQLLSDLSEVRSALGPSGPAPSAS